jgi:hypothetical protein
MAENKSHISEPIREALDNSGTEERRRRVLDVADRVDRPPAPYPNPKAPKVIRR